MELIYRLDEIETAAKKFADMLGEEKVIGFSGEMGSGKTTFIQALCRILGVTDTMGSPTFSIINEYDSGDGTIYHIDLYRCRDEEEAIRAGVEDCVYSGKLCLVEWPGKAPILFAGNGIRVRIAEVDEYKRKITFEEKR